ncbi:MAG: hypothetical protein R3Y61_08400, partial [Rikenellaceae bacterium]
VSHYYHLTPQASPCVNYYPTNGKPNSSHHCQCIIVETVTVVGIRGLFSGFCSGGSSSRCMSVLALDFMAVGGNSLIREFWGMLSPHRKPL